MRGKNFMSWTTKTQSTRSLIYSVAVVALAATGLWFGAQNNNAEANTTGALNNAVPAATFAADAPSLGFIPDHGAGCDVTGGTAKNVTFTVSGISGSVSSVELNNLTFGAPAHSWVGDIEAVLIAPNGASHMVFGRTLATTATSCGDSTDATGPYNFKDSAAAPPNGGWWQTANLLGAAVGMTSGDYRSTNIGGAGATIPMPATSMNPSFTGVANANGTWTLRLSDHGGGDTGAVSAATLTVNGAVAPLDTNTDFNGDGKTDFVVARATTTPLTEATAPSLSPISKMRQNQEVKGRVRSTDKTENALTPPIYWYTSFNGSGTTGVGQLGDAATDFIVTEDFDGDGKDDLTTWTEAAATSANFKILQSSTNTVRVEFFGQTGDDPAVVGDYDGDNKADVAVYRCPAPAAPAGQCFFFFRGSNANPSGNVTFVPWGFGNDGDFFPYTGDFDGDGKNDFCLQRTNPSVVGQGQFVLLKSAGGIEYINWGNDNDFLIPGDYDGDGKTDLCVRRTVSGLRQHFILTRTGATSQTQWGITGDISAPGDYDGDGKTDLAIWRGSATPGASRFWVLNSSNASVTQFVWGQCPAGNCDFAVAGWVVH